MFETETLLFWIKDTLASRYRTLASLQRRRRNLALRGGDPSVEPAQIFKNGYEVGPEPTRQGTDSNLKSSKQSA